MKSGYKDCFIHPALGKKVDALVRDVGSHFASAV